MKEKKENIDINTLKEECEYLELIARIYKAKFEALIYKIKYMELIGNTQKNEQQNTTNS